MDENKLARKMLEWNEKRIELELLENEIEQMVLELGKSFVVGNVRATYYKPQEKPNYKATLDLLGESRKNELIQAFTKTEIKSVTITDWKGAFLASGLDDSDLIKDKRDARVIIKNGKK